MKALSIRQPYAFAITVGTKNIENRDWPIKFRGPILIHAGKKEDADDVDGVLRQLAKEGNMPLPAIEKGYRNHRWLGAIVGAARLSDCVTKSDSPWFCGPYGFVLTERLWSNRVDCKGMLGLFDVPESVLFEVHCPPYVVMGVPSAQT